MSETQITAVLLEKYDRPGPRYTSYPTVPVWRDDFDAAAYGEALRVAAQQPEVPLSLYVHVPFCRSRCAYCGCNVSAEADSATLDDYVGAVADEMSLVAEQLQGRRRVAQCHWGGGTPTSLSEAQMTRLFNAITSIFTLDAEAEVAIETNPDSVTEAQLRCLRQLGFNRISFGVQDLDPAVQRAICRNQRYEVTRQKLELCRELGFSGINMDLIYGLPLQEEPGWMRTIEQIIAMRPDRLTIYSYAHLPQRFPHQQPLDNLPRPDTARKYALFALARQRLLDAGYLALGMDHFALPEDELALALPRGALHRNFMGYTVQYAPDQIGVGASAISEVANGYSQNMKEPDAWADAVAQRRFPVERGLRLSEDDIIRRWVIRRLMCTFSLDLNRFKTMFGVPFETYFTSELSSMEYYVREGMLHSTPEKLTVTPLGAVFIRNICMLFDAYIGDDVKTVFSRTI